MGMRWMIIYLPLTVYLTGCWRFRLGLYPSLSAGPGLLTGVVYKNRCITTLRCPSVSRETFLNERKFSRRLKTKGENWNLYLKWPGLGGSVGKSRQEVISQVRKLAMCHNRKWQFLIILSGNCIILICMQDIQ